MKIRKKLWTRNWSQFKKTRGATYWCTQQSACSSRQSWYSWASLSCSLLVRTNRFRRKPPNCNWTLCASSAWPSFTCHLLMMWARTWLVWSMRWTTLTSSWVRPQRSQPRSCKLLPACLLRLRTILFWLWQITLWILLVISSRSSSSLLSTKWSTNQWKMNRLEFWSVKNSLRKYS
jgi:hypothetical protein